MEATGILDAKSDTDLYCLHLVFMPLLSASVEEFQRSWNAHKHRGLKHKRPEWVFNEGLSRLSRIAKALGHHYTELEQVIIISL